MEIISKFGLGDKVYVLKNSKAVKMEIKSITIEDNDIYYSNSKAPFVLDRYPTCECFASIDELVAYVTSESDNVSSTEE